MWLWTVLFFRIFHLNLLYNVLIATFFFVKYFFFKLIISDSAFILAAEVTTQLGSIENLITVLYHEIVGYTYIGYIQIQRFHRFTAE